ncbi:uncharacterized protein LOC105445107 [Strongylocentrotus purpuratus]|uniref:3CxxC-type domain-containing protein n=1 Tax=Strongylocentrotus purpuratus TaxID=7668 RepID=A0A7M7MZQ3_STRPU|nr:uncharacterized protein LOC105445107 [Strongylocentrotus purpuratus]
MRETGKYKFEHCFPVKFINNFYYQFSYSTVASVIMPVDYAAIIVEVMSEEGLFPREGVRGYGQSKCENCNRSWSTYRAHVVIDLKGQEVAKIYKQKCKRCKQEHVPSFPEEEFTEMVKKALNRRNTPRSEFKRQHFSR